MEVCSPRFLYERVACRDWPPGQSYCEATLGKRTVEDAGPYKNSPLNRGDCLLLFSNLGTDEEPLQI